MFRSCSPKAFVIVALCSFLMGAVSLTRSVRAEPTDVVDLEGDTHHNPPSPTTDVPTSAPGVKGVKTDSDTAPARTTTRERDSARQEADAEKLNLRAGERIGGSPRGKAQVLGMSLQEGTHQRVKVVEVAMNSPAFDAGIMKGDEILVFQGFRGDSYRSWIDGIRRLTGDTGAGLKIPVVVARDGKQATALIEVQPKPVPRTLAQPGSPLVPPAVGPPMPAPGGPGGPSATAISGGNNVVIDNGGPFGEFFAAGAAASPNERAVAYIVRIGAQRSPNSPPVPPAPANGKQTAEQSAPTGASVAPINGARIGMAGFRDDPTGMVVMVDVGALPAGNYIVGISDPSIIGGAAVTGAIANPNVQAPPHAPPAVARTAPGATAPAAGNVNPSNSTPTDPSSAVQPPQTAKDGVSPAPVGGATGTLGQIGTITVDQSGTGRMQQRVESVQVRNVVGQAIVLYAQSDSSATAPAAVTRPGAAVAPPAAGSQTAVDATTGQPLRTPQTATRQSATPGSQVPVAAGIIQLVTDRRPPPATNPQTTQAPANPNAAVEQPAVATPPAGQNLVR